MRQGCREGRNAQHSDSFLQLHLGTCSGISLPTVTSVGPQWWHKVLPPSPSTNSFLCNLPVSCGHHWCPLSPRQFGEGPSLSLSLREVAGHLRAWSLTWMTKGCRLLTDRARMSYTIAIFHVSPKSPCLGPHLPKYVTVLLLTTYPN